MLGSPISHSRSPLLHRAAYRTLGLDWHYDAIEVREGALASFLASCGPEWVGFSLTMPLKDEAWAVAEARDDVAERTRSANTLIRRGAGWFAANTDVEGLVTAVREFLQDHHVPGVDGPVIRTAVIIGSGATARSAAAAAATLGAQHIMVQARNVQAVEGVLSVARAYGVDRVEAGPLSALPKALRNAELCVSTLPGSAAGDLAAQLRQEHGGGAGQRAVLVDVAYDPWPSALAQAWQPGLAISGLEMLLWQAVAQVQLMTGQRPEVGAMRIAVNQTG